MTMEKSDGLLMKDYGDNESKERQDEKEDEEEGNKLMAKRSKYFTD